MCMVKDSIKIASIVFTVQCDFRACLCTSNMNYVGVVISIARAGMGVFGISAYCVRA